eukprot:15473734-Alexandrium_andersonii.AAC.1
MRLDGRRPVRRAWAMHYSLCLPPSPAACAQPHAGDAILRCHLQLPPGLMHHCGTHVAKWMCAGCVCVAAAVHVDAAAAFAGSAAFHRMD